MPTSKPMGFLSALQAGDHAKGDYFSGTMQARLPSAKLGQVWEQLTSAYGQLNSFAVTARSEVNGELLRIVSLNFESARAASQLGSPSIPWTKLLGFTSCPRSPQWLIPRSLTNARTISCGAPSRGLPASREYFNAVMKKARPQLESIWRGRSIGTQFLSRTLL